jgi:hypothetical protein
MGLLDRGRDYQKNIKDFRGSALEKALLILRNRAIAATQGCCGHHGEPGC